MGEGVSHRQSVPRVFLYFFCLFGFHVIAFLGLENGVSVIIFLTGASSLLLNIVGWAPASTCTSMPSKDLT